MLTQVMPMMFMAFDALVKHSSLNSEKDAALNVILLIILCWPTVSKADDSDTAVEVEHSK